MPAPVFFGAAAACFGMVFLVIGRILRLTKAGALVRVTVALALSSLVGLTLSFCWEKSQPLDRVTILIMAMYLVMTSLFAFVYRVLGRRQPST